MASDVNDQFCAPNSVFTQGNNHYISINIEMKKQNAF
jgi:PhnB protein